jgi:hypothetical protein
VTADEWIAALMRLPAHERARAVGSHATRRRRRGLAVERGTAWQARACDCTLAAKSDFVAS